MNYRIPLIHCILQIVQYCLFVFLILMLIFPSKGREINLRFKFKLPPRTVYLHRGRALLINIRETTKDKQCGCTARGLTHSVLWIRMVSEFSFLFVKHRGLKHSRSCSHKEELRVHYRSIILGADYPITPFIFFFYSRWQILSRYFRRCLRRQYILRTLLCSCASSSSGFPFQRLLDLFGVFVSLNRQL